MKNELAPSVNYFLPQSYDQAERFADKIANSSLCPTGFKGKGGDVLIAMQMGAEVGLSPMQAIQNIAVINGRPAVYGDAAIGIVRNHPHCESIREWQEGSLAESNAIAYCAVKRKGQQEETRSFSIEQAKKAGIWAKVGPWAQYPERMLQMRARGFAIRDTFPDALRGLTTAEEAMDNVRVEVTDYEVVEHFKKNESTPLSLTSKVNDNILDAQLTMIRNAMTMDNLKNAYADSLKKALGDKDAINQITIAKNERKAWIKQLTAPTHSGEPSKAPDMAEHKDFLQAME